MCGAKCESTLVWLICNVVGVCSRGYMGLGNSCNKSKLCDGHDNDVHSSDNLCSSAHTCGCVVDCSVARITY